MENTCRLCLDGNCTIKCILSASDEVNCFWDVRDLVKEAVGIEIRSKDPVRGLCGACVNMLHSVVKFKRKCHETNRIVLEMTVPDEDATGGYFVEVEETKKVFEFSDFSDHSDNGDDLFELMMPKTIPKNLLLKERKEIVEDLLIPLPERKKKVKQKQWKGISRRRRGRIWNFMKKKKTPVEVDDKSPIDENGAVESSSQIKIEIESQKKEEIGNFISLKEIKVENDSQNQMIDPLVEQIDLMRPDNMPVKEEFTEVEPTENPDSRSAVRQAPKTPKTKGSKENKKSEKRKYRKRLEQPEKTKKKAEKPKGKKKKSYAGLCEICGIHFYRIAAHMAQHDPSLKKHKCDICGTGYAIKANLQRHMLGHRENTLTCSVCSAKLKTKKTLLEHMKTHSDELPYKCDICGRGFRTDRNIPAHRRTHTGEKPYHCRICDLRFTSRPAIRQHLRFRHDEK